MTNFLIADYLQLMSRAADPSTIQTMALIAVALVIGQGSGLGTFYVANRQTIRDIPSLEKDLLWMPGIGSGFCLAYLGVACAAGTGIANAQMCGVSYDTYLWGIGLAGTAFALPVFVIGLFTLFACLERIGAWWAERKNRTDRTKRRRRARLAPVLLSI